MATKLATGPFYVYLQKPLERRDHGKGWRTPYSQLAVAFFPPQVQSFYNNYFYEHNPHLAQQFRINLSSHFTLHELLAQIMLLYYSNTPLLST